MAECHSQADCTSLQVCAGGACTLRCEKDDTCPERQICVGQVCRTECRSGMSIPIIVQKEICLSTRIDSLEWLSVCVVNVTRRSTIVW